MYHNMLNVLVIIARCVHGHVHVHVYIAVLLDTQVGQEYEIQRIVKRDSCIPVAEVLHLSTAAEEKAVGAKFMVMTFVKVNE